MKQLLLFTALTVLNASYGQKLKASQFNLSKLNVIVSSYYGEPVSTSTHSTTGIGVVTTEYEYDDADQELLTDRPSVTYCTGWIFGSKQVVVPASCVLSPDIKEISVYYDSRNVHIPVSKIVGRKDHANETDLVFLELEARFPRQIQDQLKLEGRNFVTETIAPRPSVLVSMLGYNTGKQFGGIRSSSPSGFFEVKDKGTIALAANCTSIPGFKVNFHVCIAMQEKGQAMTGALVYGKTGNAPLKFFGSTVAETSDGDFQVLARVMQYDPRKWSSCVLRNFNYAGRAGVNKLHAVNKA